MANANDENQNLFVVYFVNDPITADADTVEVFLALQFNEPTGRGLPSRLSISAVMR
jgi:hypothetical protein